MEALVTLAAKPIAYAGSALILVSLIWLGISLKDGTTGKGGDTLKALALLTAGIVIVGFAAAYGFTHF